MEIIKMESALVSKACGLLENAAANFPNLEIDGFRVALRRNIDRGSVLCAMESGALAGYIIYSPPLSQISFLLVDAQYRSRGCGEALLRAALGAMDSKQVSVVTYCDGDALGVPARALYHKLGFQDAERVPGFDMPVQRLILVR